MGAVVTLVASTVVVAAAPCGGPPPLAGAVATDGAGAGDRWVPIQYPAAAAPIAAAAATAITTVRLMRVRRKFVVGGPNRAVRRRPPFFVNRALCAWTRPPTKQGGLDGSALARICSSRRTQGSSA